MSFEWAAATDPLGEHTLAAGAAGVSTSTCRPPSTAGLALYYGRYDVNVTRRVVEHEVEGGFRPDVRGRTLSYSYDLADDGDTLVLSLMGDDGVESRATWQRHR